MLYKDYYVYILTNYTNDVFYIGVTNNLLRRMYEHRHKMLDGFTKTYNVYKLVYFEHSNDVEGAIYREKQLKHYKRERKIKLIQESNPKFLDLYDSICW